MKHRYPKTIYSDGTHKVRQKAYKVDAVDTTAARDTFK